MTEKERWERERKHTQRDKEQKIEMKRTKTKRKNMVRWQSHWLRFELAACKSTAKDFSFSLETAKRRRWLFCDAQFHVFLFDLFLFMFHSVIGYGSRTINNVNMLLHCFSAVVWFPIRFYPKCYEWNLGFFNCAFEASPSGAWLSMNTFFFIPLLLWAAYVRIFEWREPERRSWKLFRHELIS